MSRVDFYVLAEDGDASRQRFACRLAEKAYQQKVTVHIQVGDSESARRMDELLWTFRDGSFLPHELIEKSSSTPEAPISIGTDDLAESAPEMLINLAPTVPTNATAYTRIAEIVSADEQSKTRGREHFAHYRDAGHTLETHKM